MTRQKIIIAIFIIIAIAILFLPNLSKCRRLEARYRELKERIRVLEKENRLLEERGERLEGDEYYVEKVARDKMGIVKKGEIQYKIVEEEIKGSN